MSDDAFEVQFLIPEGDRGGQWECLPPPAPMGFADEGLARAFRREVFDVERQPLRTVPFGTGPLPRPGDVTAGGAIIAEPDTPGAITDRYGVTFTQCGPIMVTPEQAENAALFGWSPTGIATGSLAAGDMLIEVAL